VNWKRNIAAAFIFLGIGSYIYFGLNKFFDLNFVKAQLESIQSFKSENFELSLLLYFVIYSLTVALSIPGAVILTLLGGAVYGVFWGTLVASFASSIGATLAFFVSRILLRDWVLGRFGKFFEAINKGIEREGVSYLFALRMVPLFPFFVVNLLMGLTNIRATSFYIVSQIGMLLGTVVYVNAGSQLATVSSLSGIISPPVILSLACVGVSPIVAKFVLSVIKKGKE
jgi:uncharacterized membrane protein YdjX (TVP38/TMEM64 family)